MNQDTINYDDIHLPEKVSDILGHDYWSLQHVSPGMVRTVTNPVKFSAFTSIIVHKGTAEADINLITHTIKGPCLINIAAGDIVFPRRISDDFDASFSVFSRRLTDSLVTQLKDVAIYSIIKAHPVIEISADDGKVYESLYSDMQTICDDPSLYFPYETALYTLAAFFFRHASKYYERYRQSVGPSLQNRIADRFIRLAQEHFRTERFLDFYAEKLDITPKHLSRTIKMQTGASPVEWITRFVILEAKVMLRSSNLNIQQIAEELHFPSQSFFGKYFKKATGMSPKDYRNSVN